jgi:alpha-1,2-glucosyltransferase
LPGYEAVLAAIGRALGLATLPAWRVASALISLPTVYFFYRLAEARDPASAPLRTAQVFVLPVLFPYFFLLYTDAFSLCVVLAALWLHTRGRPRWAALVAAAAICVRQSNVVFVAWLAARSYGEARRRGEHSFRRVFFDHAIPLAAIAGFAGFALINHGFAVGDRGMHPMTVSFGNTWLALFLAFGLFLPMGLARLPAAVTAVRGSRWRLLGLLGCVLVLCLRLGAPHPYNHIPFLLHNRLAQPLSVGGLWRLAVLLPAIAALTLLIGAARPTWGGMSHLTAALLLLLPASMIEHRYALMPLVLLQLYRPRASPSLERIMIAAWAAASGYLTLGIARGWFFL